MDAIEQLRLDVELLRAARKERAAAVRELIAAGASLSARELWGNTPLHEAAWYGNEKVARALLCAGAQVQRPNRRGSTPLHRAACKNRVDCVQLLLNAGALPNARDKEDETPLHEAVRYRSAEAAQLLLAHGAEVDARNKHGMTHCTLPSSPRVRSAKGHYWQRGLRLILAPMREIRRFTPPRSIVARRLCRC